MMPRTTCCVPGCCKRGGYKFPSASEQRKVWLIAIQRNTWLPKDNSSVCRDHFRKQDFLLEGGLLTEKLKKNAVPSLFWWTSSNDKGAGMKKLGGSSMKKSAAAIAPVPGSGDEEEDNDYDEEEEDDFEDAGALMDDCDEDYRADDDRLGRYNEREGGESYEEEEEEEEEEGDATNAALQTKAKPKKGQVKSPKAAAPKTRGKKRKLDDSDDQMLSNSKRSNVESLPEYARQLNKAYKEISRLSTRCQVLDSALKNKSLVGHRARTIYQVGKYVLPHQLSFIESQAVNSTLPIAQRRWSRRMRNISLGLHRHSRHAYNFMAKIFALPTEGELLKWGAQSQITSSAGDVAANNVSLVEAEALVDEVTFDALIASVL